MYLLQLWPGASLLGFNLSRSRQLRSEGAWCPDCRQITQAFVFEVFTYKLGYTGGKTGLLVVC